MAAKNVFIVAAKRTAFGTYGGKFVKLTATDLCEHSTKAAIQAAGISPKNIDSIIMGNVMQSSPDAAYLTRHVGIRAGLKVETPALTVNRLCGSGFQAVINGAHEILLGEAEVVVAGGSENMSQAPFALRNMRFGTTLGGKLEIDDILWTGLTDLQINTPMAITAENLGAKYGVTREDCDQFALRSQTRWRLANNAGYFIDEICPVPIKTRKGVEQVKVDEHPRETTIESLNKLPSLFKKDGLVTAGSASGICDGAASLVLASEAAVKKFKLAPLVRLVAWHAVGCDPNIMGFGPVPAIKMALQKAGKTLNDMDLVEVNEAFAAQYLGVERAAELDPDKTNVNGGAIAMGHPLGASGARITAHLVHELRRRGGKFAIGSACIGGGQGIALVLESC